MRSYSKVASHYSYAFALNLAQLPTKNSDRISLRILCPGILFGILLALLGIFDLISEAVPYEPDFLNLPKQPSDGFIPFWFFDCAIILIGLGIAFKLFATYLCYRKIFFDGQAVTIVDRVLGGKKITYKEKLENYEGVQLRIEFFQFGFWNRNRYIIELRHKNLHKIAPLYISMYAKNIRRIWKNYAKTLQLPAIVFKNDEVKKIEIEDLDKTLRTLALEKKIVSDFDINNPLPKEIVLVRRRDKKVIKVSHVLWDAYHIILLISLVFLWGGLFAYAFFGQPSFWGVFFAFILLSWFSVLHFRRDKIAVKKEKLVIVHKFPLHNFKNDEILKNDIEAIEVTENPATGRFFLSIYSNSKNIVFGKKLPIKDLQWVRAFLINDIIR